MSAEIIKLLPNRRGFISLGAALSAVVAGIAPTATAAGGDDPILALIAEADRRLKLAGDARDKADVAWFALRAEGGERPRLLYVEAERLEQIAGEVFRRIVETRATTIEGVAAKVEILFVDPENDIASILADLRALARGGAA